MHSVPGTHFRPCVSASADAMPVLLVFRPPFDPCVSASADAMRVLSARVSASADAMRALSAPMRVLSALSALSAPFGSFGPDFVTSFSNGPYYCVLSKTSLIRTA